MDRTDCPADATKDQKTEWLAGYEEAMAETEGDDFPGDRK
jgi:ribosome modulation factor